MKNNTLNVACVGCGRHMKNTLAPLLSQIKGVEVILCIDLEIDRAKEIASVVGAKHISANHQDIDKHPIDAVIVALPPNTSGGVINYLLQKSIPVYIEKPIASTSKECSKLELIASQKNNIIQVGFNFCFADSVNNFKAIFSKNIKNISNLEIEFLSRRPIGAEWGNEDIIGSWLLHNGVHALDLCAYLNPSRIVSAKAELEQEGECYLMRAVLKHQSGQNTTLKLGNLTDKFIFSLKAEADNKVISMPDLQNLYILNSSTHEILEHIPSTSDENVVGDKTGHIGSVKNFLNAVREGKTTEPNATAAKNAAVLGEMFLESIKRQSSEINFEEFYNDVICS